MVKEKSGMGHSIDIEDTSKFNCEHYTLLNTLVVYCAILFFFIFKTVYICF